MIPEAPYEVTDSNHPLAMGLENCIGIDKGCYIGQEIITRMQTRERQGKKLIRLEGNYEEGEKIDSGVITSAGTNAALAIVRANYIP